MQPLSENEENEIKNYGIKKDKNKDLKKIEEFKVDKDSKKIEEFKLDYIDEDSFDENYISIYDLEKIEEEKEKEKEKEIIKEIKNNQ
jgi:hypothetical protein